MERRCGAVILLLALSAATAKTADRPAGEPAPAARGAGLYCPMHPQVTSDKPGACPVCGMDLVPGGPPEPPITLPKAALECGGGKCRPTVAGCEAVVEAALGARDPLLRALAVPAVRDDARLADLLADPEGLVRAAAAFEAGRQKARTLLSALARASLQDGGDPQGLARLAALEARLRLGDREAAEALGEWLRAADETTRALAVGTAATDAAFLAELRRLAAKDPAASVRELARLGLADAGDPAELKRIADRWDYRTYRIHAKADPAGSRGRLRAIMSRALEGPPPVRADLSADVWFIDASAAALALLQLGEPAGRAGFHGLLARALALSSESQAEGHALILMQQLQEFAAPEDQDALVPWLATSDPAIRVTAAATCLRILRAVPLPGR